MVRGQTLLDNLRKVILNMARYLEVHTIQHYTVNYTGCAASSIYVLLADYQQFGTATCAHEIRD
jgi:hypothetical protein